MFTTLIVQPIFNLLVLIYALLPGHNFGLAIIIFTIIIRLLMWPLVKKQLHQAKAMRELQPELKRIKKATKGNRQQESAMIMELYKEKKISPFASIGLLLVQLPIFIALYSCIHRVINDPTTLVTFSYPFVRNLSWIQTLIKDPSLFDSTLFGVVDLGRAAINKGGGIYWPAMIIVAGSAIAQFFQSKQLMPTDKNSQSLRSIMKSAGKGAQPDQGEVNAAVGRSTKYFIPAMVFLFTVNLPSALSLYWLTSGLVAIAQQARILNKDEEELEESIETKKTKKVIEGEVIPPKKQSKKPKKANKKRRK